MKNTIKLIAIGAFGLSLAACSGNGSSNNPNPNPNSPTVGVQYTQIELLSRPAVKELFENFVDHQTTNSLEPYADTTLQSEIKSFTNAVRPPNTTVNSNYGTVIQSVLYPNEMAVDLSQTGTAAYLGVETGGVTGGKFGGRALTDDVIDISLGVVFGKTLGPTGLKLQPEDNEENNCLTTDNVAINATQAPTATFPYLHAPH